MKRNVLKTLLLTVVLTIFFSSCESNAPSQGSNTRTRDYCYVTFTNTTSQYCAEIYVDGVSLKDYFIEDFIGWPLWAGKSGKVKMNDINFPKDIKIDLHEISSDKQYYTKVYKTFSKQGCSFNSHYDYKFTIREDGCTMNSTSAK